MDGAFDYLSMMQLEKAPRRLPKRRPVKPRQRHGNKVSRLKYGNILSLATVVLALSWMISLPFRTQRSPEPPVILPQPPALAPAPPASDEEGKFAYNLKTPPNQVYSPELQAIVDETVSIAGRKGLPTEPLSITLIDVSRSTAHTFAGYQNQTLRFPASVAKLFWLVAFYAGVEKNLIQNEASFHSDLEQMLRVSNNDAASRILDKITDTESGEELQGADLKNWLKKRTRVDSFFQSAGYKNIQLSTKNYPIYYLHQEEPTGRDLQLRGDASQPVRNQVTTDQVARLMYEIYTRQAVSPTASRKMAYLLTRDLNPQAWKNDPNNSIKGFLPESLPPNIYFGSKVGYTSSTRNEAAFVRTLDDKAIYILVIFADDPAYAKDEEIFPAMSKYIFDRMNARSSK